MHHLNLFLPTDEDIGTEKLRNLLKAWDGDCLDL